ncbi:MAG: ArsA family ATPase [Gemmatimonadota bacterium]
MFDTLLGRASTRFVFVVGKGGVGKTTTAGALAVALADRYAATHLISTDPAHSLRDLLPEDCSANLTIEEFDARSYADAFFQKLRAPFIELIERGTYLDTADATSFLDLSIPGIDEVMAALRLVELIDDPAQHIIVDTAPTGHTVRLLDSARIIESWVAAGLAMAEKAGAVSSALVGQPIPLQALPLLHEWRQAARRFEEIVQQSSALVVTRAGAIVEAETDRLKEDLGRRGLIVAATIAVGSGKADFMVERYAHTRGCAGMREWQHHVVTSSPGTRRTPGAPSTQATKAARGEPAAPWIESLEARLIWVAGKGGVGKTTCAGAIGAQLAQQRKVCIVSTDPAGSLSEVLGDEIGNDAREVAPNLFARQIDAVREFERMRDQYRSGVNEVFASIGLQTAAQLDRKVMESLWDFAPPGIDEIISLVEITDQAGAYDLLIIDSAPTGHFLRLIEMPEIALEWVRALMRLLVKYGAAGSLDALARDLLAFARRLRQLTQDLSTPGTTAVFVITLNEPLVMAETARLSSALASAGIGVAATILNRADEGEIASEGAGSAASERRWIRAPDLHREIVGSTALRSFLTQWTLHGD